VRPWPTKIQSFKTVLISSTSHPLKQINFVVAHKSTKTMSAGKVAKIKRFYKA